MKKAQNESPFVEPLEKLAQLQSDLLAIGRDTRLTDVLTAIAEAANDVLGGHHCVVQPYDESSDRFLVDQFTPGGAPEAKVFEWKEPRKDGTARTALKGRVLTIEDYDKELEHYPFLAKGPGAFRGVATIKACIGIRLEAGGEAIGVLFVNYPAPHRFSEDELRIAELFASQAALAIRNVRLFEREFRTLSRLRGLIAATQSVSALRRDAEPKEILTKIVESANEVLDADLSVIFPYDEQTDRFLLDQLVAAGEGATTFEWQEPREKGATRRILNQRALIAINLQDAPREWAMLGSGVFMEHFQIQTAAGVPLRVGTEKVGVLYVNYQTPHSFDEQERSLIEAFANAAAIILHNTRLFDSTVRSATELESLLDITRDVTSVIADVRLTLQTIIERAVTLIGTTRGAILIYHNGFGTVEAGYSVDPAAPVSIGAPFPTNTRLQVRIQEEREPVQIEDVTSDRFLSKGERKQFLEDGIKSALIVPMVVKGEVIGSIGLDETRSTRSFTTREVELCEIIAGQAAIAIENARLFARTSERLEITLEEREQLLSLVREIDEWIAQRGGDKTELAEFTLNRFLDLFRFEAAWILLMEGQQLRIVATDPQHIEDKERLLRLDASITGLVAKEKRSIRIDDIGTAEPRLRALYQPVYGGGMRSELAVPMMVEDQVTGVLNLESSEPAAFTSANQELLETLARHLGVAIVAAEEMQERATLSEMAIEFSESLEEEETARSILDRALELIGGQFGQILTREGEVLEVNWATGGEGVGFRVRVDDCACGLALLPRDDPYLKAVIESSAAILSGRSVIIPDVDKVTRYKRVIEADKARMQSELAIPVKLDGEVVGVFNVESPKPGAFTSGKERALAEFVQRHAGEIGQALHRRAAVELKKLIQEGLSIVDEEFGQVLRPDGMELVIEYTSGDEPVGTRVEIKKLETGQWAPVTGRATMERKTVNVPDVSKDPGYSRFLGEEMKGELIVPLIVRGEAIGVINLESPVPDYFTEEHVRLLEPMASQAATAIRNAQLFDQERRRLEQMKVIHEVGRSITSILKADVLLYQVVDLIAERFDYYIAHIFLVDTDSNMAVHQAGSGEVGRALVEEGVSLRIGKEGIIGWVAANGKPLLVNDVSKEPRYSPHRLLPDTKSELAVPVEIGDRVIAVLDAQSTELDAFDEDDLFVLETLSHVVGVALENARYIETLEKTREAEMLAAVGERSGDIVHRVGGPTGAIRTRIERLREKRADLLHNDDYLARSLTYIDTDALKIQGMVRELKEGTAEPLAPFKVWLLLNSALDRIEIPKSIEVIASPDDRLPKVLTDRKLEDVFYNLMTNAVEAMPDGGKLEITAEAKGEDWVQVSIRDTGRGIPDYLLEEIFTAAFTTKREEGHGLGLWWSKAFVEKCGGTIKVQSEVGDGSCFTVRLQVAR